MLAAQNQAQQAAQAPSARAQKQGSSASGRPAAARRRADDPRFKKLQEQLDAEGKAIDDTRSGLATTQGDLVNTRTELTGSIAHTHDELVLLQKKGERNYAEFDLSKQKEFKRAGIVQIRLKKSNERHQYADLEMMVNDRNLSQKHVNLFQPVMFYMPDSPQPVEIVINDIGKDHIHGYVSSSKYRQSELGLNVERIGESRARPESGKPGRSARAAQAAAVAPIIASGHQPSPVSRRSRTCVLSSAVASLGKRKKAHASIFGAWALIF